jgi:hypothetical protein
MHHSRKEGTAWFLVNWQERNLFGCVCGNFGLGYVNQRVRLLVVA